MTGQDEEIAALKARLAALESEKQQPPSPAPITSPAAKPTPWALFIVLGVIGVSFVMCMAGANSSTHKVVYRVTGEGAASLTTSNAQGGTEQMNVALPWVSPVMEMPSGAHAYVSAQNEGSGEIRCQIDIDEASAKEATSYGQFTIASCSGRVP